MGYQETFFNAFKRQTQSILYIILGVFVFLVIIAYLIITIPVIIYRLVVTKILLKSFICPNGIKKVVTHGFGTAYATEYISSLSTNPPRPSRNTIVQQSFINCILPEAVCTDMIKKRWIEALKISNEKTESLRYPELRQYVVSWMGYLFWKDESNFQLENHLSFETPLPSANIDEYCKTLLEHLINKPYTPQKSPWEIHVVHSCRCSKNHLHYDQTKCNPERNSRSFCQICGKEEMTVFVTRIHHCLGDGISFMYAIAELFGNDLKESIASLHANRQKNTENKINVHKRPLFRIHTPFKLFVNFCHDLGFITTFLLWRTNTSTKLHITDGNKLWKHFYERSDDFPMKRMKLIKDHFGVSFSALVMHCVSVAVSNHLGTSKQNEEKLKSFLTAMVFPLSVDRPQEWINNITGAAYKLPLDKEMNSTERLRECNNIMRNVNSSVFTRIVFPLLVRIHTYHVTSVVRLGFYNRLFGTGISNFYVPKVLTVNEKYEVFKSYAAVGANDGVNATIVCTLGYNDNFHFIATADQAAMERKELKRLVDDMKHEIDVLYEQASAKNIP